MGATGALLAALAPALSATAAPRLPLVFEANRGQTNPAVRLMARGAGYRLFLTERESVFTLPGKRPIRMTLPGAAAAAPVGVDPLAAQLRYQLPGRTDATLAPAYAAARRAGVWPGVDQLFHRSANGSLEYDFRVAPNADPARIAVRFDGAGRPTIDPRTGALLVGGLRWKAPVAYQSVHGKRVAVPVRYALRPDGAIGFSLGRYEKRAPLTIDPVLVGVWSLPTTSGGDQILGITSDTAGYVFLTGTTDQATFPVRDAWDATYNGTTDAFVAKVTPAGDIVWATFFGGRGHDEGTGIALAPDGAVCVCGTTFSDNFPALGYYRTIGGGMDAFVARFYADGRLSWSTYLGGSLGERAVGIGVSGFGDIYVGGTTSSDDFPVSAFARQRTFGGIADGFIASFTSAGAAGWATYHGGSGTDYAGGFSVNRNGGVLLTGWTWSTEFPTYSTPLGTVIGPWTPNDHKGGWDLFAATYTAGGAPSYSILLGGSDDDEQGTLSGRIAYGNLAALDDSGNAYIAGRTRSRDALLWRASQTRVAGAAGDWDCWVAKVLPGGGFVHFATYLGGTGLEYPGTLRLDGNGALYLNGTTFSTDFPGVRVGSSFFSGFATRFSGSGALCGSIVHNNALGVNSPDFALPAHLYVGGGLGVSLFRFESFDLALSQAISPNPMTGGSGTARVTLTVRNNGPDPAPAADLAGRLRFQGGDPDTTTFDVRVTGIASSQGSARLNPGNTFEANLGVIPVGGRATVTLTIASGLPTDAATVRCEATLFGAEGCDANPANDSAAGTLSILPATWPRIATLSPGSSAAGAAAFSLRVDGTNFAPGMQVFWNGSPRPTSFVSATRMLANIAAADVATAGSASVTVGDGARTSNGALFLIGTPRLVPTASIVQMPDRTWRVTLRLTNAGTAAARSVRLDTAPLGTTAPTTALPITLDTIAPGATATIQLDYPKPAASFGVSQLLTLRGSFSATLRLTP